MSRRHAPGGGMPCHLRHQGGGRQPASPRRHADGRHGDRVRLVAGGLRQVCMCPMHPARAFRDAQGEIHLIISHNDNRAHIGPTLDTVKRNCSVIHEAHRSPVLAQFDDLSWISGVYTKDGKTVYALAHTELRGERTPGQCPAGKYSACLLNTVTALYPTMAAGRSCLPITVDARRSWRRCPIPIPPTGHRGSDMPTRLTSSNGTAGTTPSCSPTATGARSAATA